MLSRFCHLIEQCLYFVWMTGCKPFRDIRFVVLSDVIWDPCPLTNCAAHNFGKHRSRPIGASTPYSQDAASIATHCAFFLQRLAPTEPKHDLPVLHIDPSHIGLIRSPRAALGAGLPLRHTAPREGVRWNHSVNHKTPRACDFAAAWLPNLHSVQAFLKMRSPRMAELCQAGMHVRTSRRIS